MSNDNISNKLTGQQLKVMEWAKLVWKSRITLLIVIIVSCLIGLMIALFSPKEYKSWTTVVPQTSNSASKLSGMSSLAAMAGFNLDLSSGEELSPAIYPQIVGSVLFQLELMNTSFYIEEAEKPVTLYDYYTKYAKKSLMQKIKDLFNNEEKVKKRDKNRPVFLTGQEEKVCEILQKQVTINVDVKNGYITLYSSFPEAELSAEVADKARELLQKYITEYKIKKAKDKLLFIEERYQEKKSEFYKAQRNMAYFNDQNKYLSNSVSSIEGERLKSEYSIALSVFNELSKQLETAKIQVKEDTPVFSVIQPAKVPLKKTKPNKMLIMTVWFFLGIVLGTGFVFGKEYMRYIKANWK